MELKELCLTNKIVIDLLTSQNCGVSFLYGFAPILFPVSPFEPYSFFCLVLLLKTFIKVKTINVAFSGALIGK